MPELPEVETVRRQLAPTWEGQRITTIWSARPNYFFLSSPALLRKRLAQRTTLRLTRIGKYLLAQLDDGSRLLCHLGMTGQITARPIERDPHVHLVLGLASGQQISFRDVRKFGKVEWIAAGASSSRLDKLGPDALSLRAAALARGLAGRKVAIKAALLDQSITAGVGNIYADETLFAAGIHPSRPAGRLTSSEIQELARQVRRILRASVKRGGSTINDYIQPDGTLGGYQDWHQVYGKSGAPCPACSAPIEREVIGGRSSHYCRRCQK